MAVSEHDGVMRGKVAYSDVDRAVGLARSGLVGDAAEQKERSQFRVSARGLWWCAAVVFGAAVWSAIGSAVYFYL